MNADRNVAFFTSTHENYNLIYTINLLFIPTIIITIMFLFVLVAGLTPYFGLDSSRVFITQIFMYILLNVILVICLINLTG